jgi:hypothetical protein
MPSVLIVSPHFPPIDAADMHRVRLSLPYFRTFGWEPIVLAVDPRYVEGTCETLLLETIPQDISVVRVRALSTGWTRKLGLGNIALRALPYLYAAGARILQRGKIDLVYFSTTAFPAPILGRLWKRRFATPFVVDVQDLWVTDYYRDRPKSARPPKFWFADRLHRLTEPWTMAAVDGLIAVSGEYVKTLRNRYPRLDRQPVLTLPFAASGQDMDVARRLPGRNRFFRPADGQIHGVYVGRGGADMAPALRTIFQGFRLGLERYPELFGRIQLHFVGTDYAPPQIARKTIEPVAQKFQLGNRVLESACRVPYFEALRLLLEADFLVIPGSDDPHYTASKIYPYILAEKPLLGVFHPSSSVCEVVQRTRAGVIFPLGGAPQDFCELWKDLLESRFVKPRTDWLAFAPYLAREMTRRECELFDLIVPRATYAHASE